MSSSDTSYSRQLGASSIRGFLWLTWLWLLASTISPSLSFDVSCCPEGAVWQYSANCSDGTKIRLQCPHGIFLIDPEQNQHDNFTVIHENDTAWLLPDINHEKIPADSFCTAKSMRSGGEIALACFDEELITEGVSMMWKSMLVCIVSIISAIFLIATLAVYVILPELRELQDKAMMAAVTTLAVSYTVLSIQHVQPIEIEDYTICISFGFILYFSFMSAFFWLNIVAFNVWRTVW